MAAAFHQHTVNDPVASHGKHETGRLSYHDIETMERATRSEASPECHDNAMDPRHQSPSLPTAPLSPETRLAMRKEAYDAALGLDDMLWSEVGLVSTGGHQVKEEEL